MLLVKTFLSQPSPPLWRFCLLAWPLALIPSVLLAASVFALLAAAGVDFDTLESLGASEVSATLLDFFGVVVFAPVVETFLLVGGVRLLAKLSSRKRFLAVASALAWGLLHSMFGPLWFFGTVWSFFVFSCAYLTWRSVSFRHAYTAAAVPHVLINLTVMVLVFADV